MCIDKHVGGLFVGSATKLQGLRPNVYLAEVSLREYPLQLPKQTVYFDLQ